MYDGPTLGWGVLRHGARYLPAPDDPGRPFILTDEQVDFILRFYALDADTGDHLYRRGVIEMAKGWGKSPLAAFVAVEELVGPVVFDRWDDTAPGGAVGRPWTRPWVQIAAVSEDQTDNTYNALYEMLATDDARPAKALGIDLGRTRCHLVGRPGVLEPVTAAAGSREGQRLTFAVEDETHLWTRRNGGVKLAGTLRRNAAKMGGRTLETTNAPLLGEKSVAEAADNSPGVLHLARRPSVIPDPRWTDARLKTALAEVYGDAVWIDLDRLVREIRDPATSWDDALRFYFNVRSAGAGRAVDPRVWASLAKPREVPPGTRIGLGFDGSISQDATVLRGCTADGYSFNIETWVRPPGAMDWRVDRRAVGQAVARAFETYSVGRMLCDPFKWQTEIEDWAVALGDAVELLDTNSPAKFAPVVDRWLTGIREASHTHDGDPVVDLHVTSAHLRKVRIGDEEGDGRTRYVLIKGDDHGRIDGAVADALAYEAALTMADDPGPYFIPVS